VLPLTTLITSHSFTEVLVLAGTMLIVLLLGLPLARHLWNTPSNAPEHLPHRTALEDQAAAAIDRYSTRWGGGWTDKKEDTQ
jgi:hypothetical protein